MLELAGAQLGVPASYCEENQMVIHYFKLTKTEHYHKIEIGLEYEHILILKGKQEANLLRRGFSFALKNKLRAFRKCFNIRASHDTFVHIVNNC